MAGAAAAEPEAARRGLVLYKRSGEPRGCLPVLLLACLAAAVIAGGVTLILVYWIDAERSPPARSEIFPLPSGIAVLDESTGCEDGNSATWCYRAVVVIDEDRSAQELVDSLASYYEDQGEELERQPDGEWTGDLDIVVDATGDWPPGAARIRAFRSGR